jgi:hypothetical protein
MPSNSDLAIIEAYRAADHGKRGIDAAYCAADAVYRAQHPTISNPMVVRSRVLVIVSRAIIATGGSF